MEIKHKLKPNSRSREYESYSPFLRGRVAYVFLTNKEIGHREIDQDILQLDAKHSRGYQAMGILHYQGLYVEHKGVLEFYAIDAVISKVQNIANASRLLTDLLAFKSAHSQVDSNYHQEKFTEEIEKSLSDEHEKRLARLNSKSDEPPRKIEVLGTVLERDPDVVAEALHMSKGFCGECSQPAPFLRKKNKQPYLEVHHIVPMSKGGKDNLNNVIALCPNCHRKAHFG